MTYRPASLEVLDANPYANDALKRKESVDFLLTLLKRLPGPFVLALDGPWGSGKTTLINMLRSALKSESVPNIYFSAWEVDHVTDPLVALVSCVSKLATENTQDSTAFTKHFTKVKKVTSLLAKRTIVVGTKILTLNALDLEKEHEEAVAQLATGTVSDVIDAFNQENELLSIFKDELAKAIACIDRSEEKHPAIMFIDDLDRCRPTFAVELLERIKHLFEVPNVVFVLSIDKRQLASSISAIYGPYLDSSDYLRRFIDLEFLIPKADSLEFTKSLISRFNLEKDFTQRTDPRIAQDEYNFVRFFTSLADAFDLSLRNRERCITRLRLVMDQTTKDDYLDPAMVAFLIVLRQQNANLFQRLARSESTSIEVMDYLATLPTPQELERFNTGLVIEAYVIAANREAPWAKSRISNLKDDASNRNSGVPDKHREASNKLLNFIDSILGGERFSIDLTAIAAKVDIAARIQ